MSKVKVILVSHTHWDREWYYTFDQYRYRLVQAIDKALEIFDKYPEFHSFMLDGQVAPVLDYLEVKPERREELVKRIKEGKLLIGPWFIQPDEFLVSGESLVRNLMLGIRTAEKLGKVMKIGYLPDTFGHTAQLPQMLKGFDLDTFFFHRGMPPIFEESGTPFIWKAPDGSRVLAFYLYRGYCNLMDLPPDPEKARQLILGLYETWRKHLKVSVLPGMVGCDHHLPREYIPKIAKELKDKLPFEVVQGSLEEVVEIALKEKKGLKEIKGELLSSHYSPVLYGTWSSRTYLKQKVFENEVLLTYLVEPLWTISWILGADYPGKYIWLAWKYLLLSQPHDSICGCSIDEVHRECVSRLDKARTLAEELLECTGRRFSIINYYVTRRAGYNLKWHALPYINSRINMTFEKDADFYLTAFNTLPWERKTPVKLTIMPRTVDEKFVETFLEKSPEGYKLALDKIKEKGEIKIDFIDKALKDSTGKIIPIQVKKKPNGAVEVTWADELPPLGYKCYAVVSYKSSYESDLKTGENFIENQFLRIEFDLEKGGVFKVIDKRSGRVYKGLNLLEDNGDKGDEYDYSPPEEDRVIKSSESEATLEIVEKGSVAVTAKLSFTMRLPKSLTPDRKARSPIKVDIPVEVYVTLYTSIPRIDVKTVFFNIAKDHRLRVVFPTGIKAGKHFAETHYYVIERENRPPYYYIRENGEKVYLATYPTRLWVGVLDENGGLVVATKGLYEYEVREGENGSEIIYTLMRCVGWLSRSDLLTRPRGAGPQVETPDAQNIGERIFEYTIIPLTKKDLFEASQKAREYVVPAVAHEDLPHKGTLPPQYSFLRVNGAILTAFKKCEDDDTIIVRIFNPLGEDKLAILEFYKELTKAWFTNLNEKPVKEVPVKGNRVEVKLKPYEIKTIKAYLS